MSKDGGVFVFEEPIFRICLWKKFLWSNLWWAYLYIFRVAISKIAAEFDLKLIDLIPQSTHGGSMRYVFVEKNSKRSQSKNAINKIISYEKDQFR